MNPGSYFKHQYTKLYVQTPNIKSCNASIKLLRVITQPSEKGISAVKANFLNSYKTNTEETHDYINNPPIVIKIVTSIDSKL